MPTEKAKPKERPEPEKADDEAPRENLWQGLRQETDPGAAQDDPDAGVVH